MFLMSSKAPNTREDKLCNEHKSHNNHSVIGLWDTIVHIRFKYAMNILNIFIASSFLFSFEDRIDTEIKKKNVHKCA